MARSGTIKGLALDKKMGYLTEASGLGWVFEPREGLTVGQSVSFDGEPSNGRRPNIATNVRTS